MVPNTLKELIRVSRKTAKEFKQAIEDVAELIREKQLNQSLQRQPVRVPVRSQHPQHPLAGGRGIQRRNFSTTRDVNATFRNAISKNFIRINTGNVSSSASRSFKPTLSNTFRAVIYQAQPFRTSTRAQINFIRGGIGSGMYTHFLRHNARMFSTFGPNVTHQAVQNLSQSLRTFFIKGGKFSHDVLTNSSMNHIDVGRLHSNESFANGDIKLASTVSETAGATESGCFVEFNMSTPSVSTLVPESGYFDDDLSMKMEEVYQTSIKLQQKVINDVKLFRENIGSTSYKFDKKRERLRFYCPNCDVVKMESLLQEHGISMGVVKRNEEIKTTYVSNPYYSNSNSSISSVPQLESDGTNSILSTTDEITDSGNSYVCLDYSAIENTSSSEISVGSILSSSNDYFEVPSIAIRA